MMEARNSDLITEFSIMYFNDDIPREIPPLGFAQLRKINKPILFETFVIYGVLTIHCEKGLDINQLIKPSWN